MSRVTTRADSSTARNSFYAHARQRVVMPKDQKRGEPKRSAPSATIRKGQTERIHYGNGTTTRYDYDRDTFRLIQLRTTRPALTSRFLVAAHGLRDNTVLQQLNYTYDPMGNITEIFDEAYEPIFFRNQRVEPRSRYTSDALYRLIEASGRQNGAVGPPSQIEHTGS